MSLFCGNISHSASPRDVEQLFSKFGQCRVDFKRGFAFIDFEDDRDAEDAMRDLQGQDLNGMRINIEWSKRHLARRGIPPSRRHEVRPDRYDRFSRRDDYHRGYERDRYRGGGGRRDYDYDRDRDYGRRSSPPPRGRSPPRGAPGGGGGGGGGRSPPPPRDGRSPLRGGGGGRDERDRSPPRRRDSRSPPPPPPGRYDDDRSPLGAGSKRGLDDERSLEHGDSSRRRTDDGYERKDKEYEGNGNVEDKAIENGNGIGRTDDDYEREREYERRDELDDGPLESKKIRDDADIKETEGERA